MNSFACLLVFVFAQVATADIPWSHNHFPVYHGPSSFSHPSFDATASHIKAKYEAKKAHDLAKLRSSIYGIGFGLYGFRYGSHFPKYFKKPFPLFPFIKKYPIFYRGLHHYPLSFFPDYFFFEPYDPTFFDYSLDFWFPKHYQSISGHLLGFGYPKTYSNSYYHSYEYGKGYSRGHKHSYEYKKPFSYGYHHYPGIHIPGYVKKEFSTKPIIYKYENPTPDGYEYAWVKKTPEYVKYIPSHELSAPDSDSVYGIRYKEYGPEIVDEKPSDGLVFEEVPLKSKDYVFVPSSEVAFIGDVHDEESFIPKYELKHDEIGDLKSDDNFHALNIRRGPKKFKFHDSDFVAFGSEKSEVKKSKD